MITVVPQERDLAAAIWMRRKRLFTGKQGWFVWFGAAGTVLGGVLVIVFGPKSGVDASYGYWLLGIYAWVWGLVGLSFLLTPIKVRRLYKRLGLGETSYTLDWDGEKLTMEDKHSRSALPWQEFTQWFEDKRIFMLYRRGMISRFIPKRILSENQLEELRYIFREQIGPAGVARK